MYDYNTTTTQSSGSPLISLLYVAAAVLVIVALWKIFTKAGRPGWAAIVPFYNVYTLVKVVGRPGWWTLLFFIPLLNIVFALVVALDMAKVFGKSTLFAIVGLFIFPYVGYSILGFGSAKYLGTGTSDAATSAAVPPATPAV